MRKKYIAVGVAAAALIILEITLRIFLGFGNPPLFEADEDVGYYYKANQDIKRYGNRMNINDYHQRSEKLLKNPSYRILLVGDSVANGGALINQKDTISEILENMLNKNLHTKGEVLNASTPSWGIQNEYAYLKTFGIFDADIVILQINTDDLVQQKSTQNSLNMIAYPTKKPMSAIAELVTKAKARYGSYQKTTIENRDSQTVFNRNVQALEKIIKIVKKEKKELIVLIVPKKIEVKTGRQQERMKEFIKVLNRNRIKHIDILNSKLEIKPEYFRDKTHLNQSGNHWLAKVLYDDLFLTIEEIVKEKK